MNTILRKLFLKHGQGPVHQWLLIQCHYTASSFLKQQPCRALFWPWQCCSTKVWSTAFSCLNVIDYTTLSSTACLEKPFADQIWCCLYSSFLQNSALLTTPAFYFTIQYNVRTPFIPCCHCICSLWFQGSAHVRCSLKCVTAE